MRSRVWRQVESIKKEVRLEKATLSSTYASLPLGISISARARDTNRVESLTGIKDGIAKGETVMKNCGLKCKKRKGREALNSF